MTADEAIRAHHGWKDRLRVAMAKREQLDIEKIRSDCHCDFGKWLREEGFEIFGQFPEHEECLQAHAAFHFEAAKVAQLINEGQLLPADRMLASGTDYARASEVLTIKLKGMFNIASRQANAV